MMNESHRNDAYYEGIKTAVQPGKLVLEIGAGSGLLSMMAAKLGANHVVACEAEPLVAKTATEIVKTNGFANTVTILSKISYDVELGKDLPEKADVLIHEIFPRSTAPSSFIITTTFRSAQRCFRGTCSKKAVALTRVLRAWSIGIFGYRLPFTRPLRIRHA